MIVFKKYSSVVGPPKTEYADSNLSLSSPVFLLVSLFSYYFFKSISKLKFLIATTPFQGCLIATVFHWEREPWIKVESSFCQCTEFDQDFCCQEASLLQVYWAAWTDWFVLGILDHFWDLCRQCSVRVLFFLDFNCVECFQIGVDFFGSDFMCFQRVRPCWR